MCVTSLLSGPRADLWPFYGFLCKRFSLYIKVYQGWALQRGVVSKTKHSKTKTEARSTLDRKRSTQNSKTKHPKTRHRSVLYKHETNANTAGIKHDNESNSPVPHHRAWSQAITLEQILPGSDLIWSRSVIDIQYVRLQNNRFFSQNQ